MTPSGFPVVMPSLPMAMRADSISITTAVTNASIYGGNTSSATSGDGNDSINLATSVSNSFVQGNGGNDTMNVGTSVFGGSSIYGGQGADFMTVGGTVTGSTVGGNLGAFIILKMSSKARLSTVVAVSSTTPLSTL